MRFLGSTFSALTLSLMLLMTTAPVEAVESNAFKYFGSTIYIAEWSKLRHLAARGNPHAMFQLANYYISPPQRSGIPQNFKKAAELYLGAAIKGHKEAQHNLGVLYLDGIGVKQNLAEAYGWFKIAAESGSRAGQEAVEILNQELSVGQKERAKEAEQRLKQEYKLPLTSPSND